MALECLLNGMWIQKHTARKNTVLTLTYRRLDGYARTARSRRSIPYGFAIPRVKYTCGDDSSASGVKPPCGLLIAGRIGYAFAVVDKIAPEPTQLFIVPGAGHVDLYDRVNVIPWDTLTSFFSRSLASGLRQRDAHDDLVLTTTSGVPMMLHASIASVILSEGLASAGPYAQAGQGARNDQLPREGVECLLARDSDTGKAILRDSINATIGFEELSRRTPRPAKSVMRMLSPSGNPHARNLFEVIHYLHFEWSLRASRRIVDYSR